MRRRGQDCRVEILGCAVDRVSLRSATEKLEGLIKAGGAHQAIVLPATSLMYARRDRRFLDICNGASMVLPDGVPLLWASRILGAPIPGRVAGSLPRFTATSPARPGLTVGSTLDGGPNWADGSRWFLPTREVDGGVVITLMRCRTGVALPMLSPADVLHIPAGMAGFR